MRLSDGSSIEGVIRRMNFGNNAGRGGWRYYGEYELESIDGARWVIDVLDIESACDMEKAATQTMRQRAGLTSSGEF
jgi:hypothetical protein